MVVTNRTKCLRSRQIEKIFRIAREKQSGYYVDLGSCKQAVPPAAEIVSQSFRNRYFITLRASVLSAVRVCADSR
jgi:hypothetical protein